MNSYIYSPNDNAFYPLSMQELYVAAGTWPSDGVIVSDEVFAEFTKILPDKQTRVAGEDGFPCWADIPAPTVDKLIAVAEQERSQLLSVTTTTIAPLVDAVELGIATDEEKHRYNKLRKYRVLLTRVDTSTAPNITWPTPPDTE